MKAKWETIRNNLGTIKSYKLNERVILEKENGNFYLIIDGKYTGISTFDYNLTDLKEKAIQKALENKIYNFIWK